MLAKDFKEKLKDLGFTCFEANNDLRIIFGDTMIAKVSLKSQYEMELNNSSVRADIPGLHKLLSEFSRTKIENR